MDTARRAELEQRRRDLRATRIRCPHGVVEPDPDHDRGCGGLWVRCRCCGLNHCVDGGHGYLCWDCRPIPVDEGGKKELHRHIISSIPRRVDDDMYTLCGHEFNWGTWRHLADASKPCDICQTIDEALSSRQRW